MLTAVTTTVVSFLLPKTYMSTSRISLEKGTSDIAPLNGMQSGETAFDPYFIQTELEVIQSQEIIGKVVAKCNLTNEPKFWHRNELTEIEARKILEKAIDIRQIGKIGKTSIIDLRVYQRDKILAKDIAQALAEVYQDHRTDAQKKRVEIIDNAYLPVRAVRPNIPLNITLGVVAGLILGVGLAFFIEHLDTAIVDAQNLLIKSGFNVSVDDLSKHEFAGGDVKLVAAGMIKAKEKNIDLSFEQACALDLKDKGLLEED